MKIAILGAGAMGCIYGSRLSSANKVTLIDVNQTQVDTINRNGLTVIEEHESHTYSIPAKYSGDVSETFDMVIVFVKSIHTQNALQENHRIFGKDTIVVTLQNGAGNDRDIMKFVSPANIIIGTSKHNSVTKDFGVVSHTNAGATTIGSMADATATLLRVADIFSDAGLEVVVSDDIQRIIWSKLFINCSVNTLTALLETKIGFVTENNYAWDFAKRIIYEAVDVAEEDGTYFDRREVLEMVKNTCELAKDGYASMYQDRQKKVQTEIDKINGAIVNQARLYGVPTPYNALVVDLIHAVEGTYL